MRGRGWCENDHIDKFRHGYYTISVSFLFQERNPMKINSNNLTQSYERKSPVQEQYSQPKAYEELNHMDSFVFESVTEWSTL